MSDRPRPPKKLRLDALLVERGLVETRSKAKALVLAGQVVLGDHRADKPGQPVSPDAAVRIKGKDHHYVSRGALKLRAALEAFPVEVAAHTCFDVGASTGGFTQVWLERGAARVFALDVGHNQLAWSLRNDDRVVSLERTHIKDLTAGALDPAPTRCSIDVSFIGLAKVLPWVAPHLAPGARVVALVKPQFEAGRAHVGKGGIVRDEAVRQRCVDDVRAVGQGLGWSVVGVVQSPIEGADGNVEFLVVFDGGTA